MSSYEETYLKERSLETASEKKNTEQTETLCTRQRLNL